MCHIVAALPSLWKFTLVADYMPDQPTKYLKTYFWAYTVHTVGIRKMQTIVHLSRNLRIYMWWAAHMKREGKIRVRKWSIRCVVQEHRPLEKRCIRLDSCVSKALPREGGLCWALRAGQGLKMWMVGAELLPDHAEMRTDRDRETSTVLVCVYVLGPCVCVRTNRRAVYNTCIDEKLCLGCLELHYRGA